MVVFDMIEVKNLVKRYGHTVAVNDVSFEVNPGEILGLIGPNGAGKTTTMRILTCYIGANAGEATVCGYDLFEQPLEVRKHIGYLPENAPLYTNIGVLNYLNFITQARGVPKGERKSRIKEMIEVCGLESIVQKDVGELSKGFRQRLGLAQTLIHGPEVLILDEPTSGLDPIQIIQIRNLIKAMGKEKTVILSTHILPIVEETCDRILIINNGKIVANGTQEELAVQVQGGDMFTLNILDPQEETQKSEGEASLPASIFSQLGSLNFVNSVEQISQDNGLVTYQVKTQRDANAEGELFQCATANQWNLTGLQKEFVNLEEVFLHFTLPESSE